MNMKERLCWLFIGFIFGVGWGAATFQVLWHFGQIQPAYNFFG